VSADLLAEYTARNNAALRELVDIHGVELRQLPVDVLSGIRKISYAMTKEIVDPNDELAKRIYNSYQTYRKGALSYQEISERAYINARAAK
jgi:TRAP-type mannitol/chloroaromatic compound transport system substrate-binding protein